MLHERLNAGVEESGETGGAMHYGKTQIINLFFLIEEYEGDLNQLKPDLIS